MQAIFATLPRASAACLLAALCLCLTGCFDDSHYTHRDFVSEVAGDAIAVNTATQTINPWPKEAKDSNINVDGKRLGIAIKRYQADKSTPPRGLNTSGMSDQGSQAPQQDIPDPQK